MAYFLAKNELKYSDEYSIGLVDEYMEHFQYSLIKASVNLAKEFGKCDYFHRTKYSKGILPIDTYNKNVDQVCSRSISCDWEHLRGQILEHGMRNSCLSACMPVESSSVVSNSTSSTEPIRDLVTIKKSKMGLLKQVAPEVKKYGKYYQTAFEMTSNKGYLNIIATMQKYVDQAMSVNNYYNPLYYDEGNIPMSVIMGDVLYAYKMGIKSLYYSNTWDGASTEIEGSCSGGGCEV
tara:strand:- start:117 stop:821 length:705 start_codon:yes stop_codon:yes gene_type:complete